MKGKGKKIVLGSYDEKPSGFHQHWIDDTWIISDIEPRFPNMEKIDARDIPYKNVEALYASHLLEHIRYDEVLDVLKHWRKVLKKGGYVIINVPDMHWFLDNWMKLHLGEECESKYFYNKERMMWILEGPSDQEHDKHKSPGLGRPVSKPKNNIFPLNRE